MLMLQTCLQAQGLAAGQNSPVASPQGFTECPLYTKHSTGRLIQPILIPTFKHTAGPSSGRAETGAFPAISQLLTWVACRAGARNSTNRTPQAGGMHSN